MCFKKFLRKTGLTCFFCCLLLVIGCAAQKINLYSRTTNPAPALTGKTVAVLPPLAVGGGDARITMGFDSTLNYVFSGDIAGIHFKPPQSLINNLQQNPDAFLMLSRKITKGFPMLITAEGEEKTIFDLVNLQAATATAGMTPDQLEFSSLNVSDSEYVLVSVPFNHIQKTTEVLTFFGILPFAGFGGMYASPQCVLSLYESKTGQRAWEGHLGAYTKNGLPVLESDIVLGAAYLVTGDIEIPLDRMLEKNGSKK